MDDLETLGQLMALAASPYEYPEIVGAVLDVLESALQRPFLGLRIGERERLQHYVRSHPAMDRVWVDDLTVQFEETGELSGPHWSTLFPTRSRSGRVCILALAAPSPQPLADGEKRLAGHLAHGALLTLEHALLLDGVEGSTDNLTGIANHRRLHEILDYEIRRHRRSGQRLALILLDVEGLDSINRHYGRHYGNHILKRIAEVLQGSVRPVDLVARSGMDEFAVILPETEEDEAQELADRLHNALAGVRFAGGTVGIVLSVITARMGEPTSAEDLLRRGERALHEAKLRQRGWEGLVPGRRW